MPESSPTSPPPKTSRTPGILLLGGTSEAYQLADMLATHSFHVITSLAGRTQNPRKPTGQYRIGGFGGIEGIIHYLEREKIDYMIDATHPFANQMTQHAAVAAAICNIPLLRLERPLWQKQTGDTWIEVTSTEQAIAALIAAQSTRPIERVFLALGRQHLHGFSACKDLYFIARMIETADDITDFATLEIILGKPGKIADELAFLQSQHVDIIVCRNSGGTASYGKIAAARQLQIPVIIIGRTPLPDIKIVTSPDEALLQLKRFLQI